MACRRKIEIRRIEDEQARYVCFSKRRPGLFKKCSELAILCGAEVAAIVFSPTAAGKAFSFGHPSVEAIIERFDPTGQLLVGAGAAGEDCNQLVQLNRRFAEQLDMEKARKDRAEAAMAKERAKGSPVAEWLHANVRDLGEDELMAYVAVLTKVKAAIAAHYNQVLQDALNHGRAMAATARARSSDIIRQALLPPPQQFLLSNHGRTNNNNYQVQAPPPEQFLLANNNYQVQALPLQQFLLANNNYQVQAPPQQFILTNHGAGFLYQFGAGNANNNNAAEIDMQINQMMMTMAMPPPPGFAGASMEMMMLLQQGFGGFPGPY